MKNTLVMLNMSHQFDWDKGIVNRNYHVLRNLQRSGRFSQIVSIDFLPFSMKKKAKVALKGKLYKKSERTVFYKPSFKVNTLESDTSVGAGETILYNVTATRLDYLDDFLAHIGVHQSTMVLWSYNPFASDVFEKYPQALRVFDAVDNWVEHPAYTQYTQELTERYRQIRNNADVIFTVSEGLVEMFEKKGHVFFIPNGVDAHHFGEATCDTSAALVLNDRKKDRPLIGYHGVIQSRVNVQLLEYIADHNKSYDFVIVGPVWKDMKDTVKSLGKRDNVYVTGAVKYADLPKVISCFDVAMIPHKIDRFTQSMNPLKMYEYLAAGKPIVSTAVAGADQFEDLISMAISPEEFSKEIKEALERDSDAQRERRKTVAANHSWEQRVQIMMKIIDEEDKVKI